MHTLRNNPLSCRRHRLFPESKRSSIAIRTFGIQLEAASMSQGAIALQLDPRSCQATRLHRPLLGLRGLGGEQPDVLA